MAQRAVRAAALVTVLKNMGVYLEEEPCALVQEHLERTLTAPSTHRTRTMTQATGASGVDRRSPYYASSNRKLDVSTCAHDAPPAFEDIHARRSNLEDNPLHQSDVGLRVR